MNKLVVGIGWNGMGCSSSFSFVSFSKLGLWGRGECSTPIGSVIYYLDRNTRYDHLHEWLGCRISSSAPIHRVLGTRRIGGSTWCVVSSPNAQKIDLKGERERGCR